VLLSDNDRLVLEQEVTTLRTRSNALSKEIGRATASERQWKIDSASELKRLLADAEGRLRNAKERTRTLALGLPNPADLSVPDGGEDEFEVVRTHGAITKAPALDHAAFAETMGFVDAAHAAEASGARFAYLLREAVLLEFALVQWVLNRLVSRGFIPVVPPVL